MDLDHWETLQSIVEGARPLGGSDRADFVRRACHGDMDLLREVQSLLDFESRVEGFLDPPDARALAACPPCRSRDYPPGTRIGRYTITDRLGSGGSGVVYRALQDVPQREVALKVIHAAGPFEGKRQALFRREVLALARLRHPAIAAIYDAGATADGAGYFAMELVSGTRVTDYAMHGALPLRARLDLFCAVCDGVQSAHQRGVIHRDLKPAHILIEAGGQPRIIDFGLAKLCDPPPAMTTLISDNGQVIGTLAYMSPEQAGAMGDVIDVRSDVYSLGVILFELLTGGLPYDVTSVPLPAALSLVATCVPRKLGESHPSYRGDIETIVAKAIDKDPERRYRSPGELSADIRRHLEGFPIDARRDSAAYVMKKYAVRHRRSIAAAASTAAVLLTLFAGFMTYRAARNDVLRRAEIDRVVSESRRLIDENREARSSSQALQGELRAYTSQLTAQYFPAEKDRRMRIAEADLADTELQRERNHYEVLSLLSLAERLGSDPERTQQVRGELFLDEYLDEQNYGDWVRGDLFRELVLQNDPAGELALQLTAQSTSNWATDPPGADVYLFREVEQALVVPGGEHRYVPVPVGEVRTPVPPGSWCLVVTRGAEGVQSGDVITSVAGFPIQNVVLVSDGSDRVPRYARLVSADGMPVNDLHDVARLRRRNSADGSDSVLFEFAYGSHHEIVAARRFEDLGISVDEPLAMASRGGAPADVWRHGRLDSMELPPGLGLRRTSRPLFLSEGARVGVTPIHGLALDAGNYVLVFERDGDERIVISIASGPGQIMGLVTLALHPVGTSPPDYARVPGDRCGVGGDYWIKRSEVTVAEYLAFLNDPETLEHIASCAEPQRFPRSSENARAGGFCPRGPDGQYRRPEGWKDNEPIRGISWLDARAYAEWLTRRARATGWDRCFALPTIEEWTAACIPYSGVRKFVFGFRFYPKWTSSCYARPTPNIEPIMSFPRDESPYGVLDTAGSVSEWLDDWWLVDRGLRRHAGGSWADGGPQDLFGVAGGNGRPSDAVSSTIGFRVVMRQGAATTALQR